MSSSKSKFLEAELLNSILIDSEKELDEDFQRLYLTLIDNLEEDKSIKYNFDNNLNTDLILYSAMLRIADLPLSESFLNLDKEFGNSYNIESIFTH